MSKRRLLDSCHSGEGVSSGLLVHDSCHTGQGVGFVLVMCPHRGHVSPQGLSVYSQLSLSLVIHHRALIHTVWHIRRLINSCITEFNLTNILKNAELLYSRLQLDEHSFRRSALLY